MKYIKFIIIFLLVLVIVGLFVTKYYNSKLIVSKKFGYIDGKISYPSSIIPSQTVCAERIDTKQTVCSIESDIVTQTFTCGLADWQNHMGEIIPGGEYEDCLVGHKMPISYKMKLPTGEYYVYSFLSNKDNNENNRAYYSEFVTCGLSIQCPSHKPIIIKVAESQIVSNVDPVDWYK